MSRPGGSNIQMLPGATGPDGVLLSNINHGLRNEFGVVGDSACNMELGEVRADHLTTPTPGPDKFLRALVK